jgi:hypothetical protein
MLANDYKEIQHESTKDGLIKLVNGNMWKEPNSQPSYTLYRRNRMIEILIEIVQEKESNILYAEDLIQSVSLKWITSLMNPRLDAGTVYLATKLLYVVWNNVDYPGSRFKETFVLTHTLLQSRFNIISLYLPLLGILCNADFDQSAYDSNYDLASLLALLTPKPTKQTKKITFCSEIFPTIISMISSCIRTIAKKEQDSIAAGSLTSIIHTTVSLFSAMYMQIDQMKDALNEDILDELFIAIFPLVSREPMHSIDHGLDLLKKVATEPNPQLLVDRSAWNLKVHYRYVSTMAETIESRFGLINPKEGESRSALQLYIPEVDGLKPNNAVRSTIDCFLELFLTVSVESIMEPGKIHGGLEMVVAAIPPCSTSSMMDLEELISACAMNSIISKLNRRITYFADSKISSNIAKFISQLTEKLEQGLFLDKFLLVDFALHIAKLASDSEEDSKKGNRPSYDFGVILKQASRAFLVTFCRITELGIKEQTPDIIMLLQKCQMYSSVLISSNYIDTEHLKCLMMLLMKSVTCEVQDIVNLARAIWKTILLQKPNNVFAVLKSSKGEYQELVVGFSKLLDNDEETFSSWLTSKRVEVFALFEETAGKCLEEFIVSERRNTKDLYSTSLKARQHKFKKKKKRLDLDHQIVIKYNEKTRQWVAETQTISLSQSRKYKIDYQLMQAGLSVEWNTLVNQLGQEHAILAKKSSEIRWKLDFTEARARTRKKLRQNEDLFIAYQSKSEKVMENIKSPVAEVMEIPLPVEETDGNSKEDVTDSNDSFSDDDQPLAEIKALGQLDIKLESGGKHLPRDEEVPRDEEMPRDDEDWEEVNLEENQNMRIQRLLHRGDTILEIVNCARLVGLELIEGIVLICQQNMYIVDNYFKRQDGEIQDYSLVNITDRNIYHLIVTDPNWKPNETAKPVDTSAERHTCRQCAYIDIKEVHKRLYLFRNVAMELFLSDGRNFFLSFWTTKSRDGVYNRLLGKSQLNTSESVAGISNQNNVLQAVLFGGSPLAELTQKWQNREISNLAYLMHLNTLAGRSYNDLTQYPIFPWILSNYYDDEIDLEDPDNFRDLSLPMGGQGSGRAEQFSERFLSWDDPTMPGCHYGTHYSSSMIVCSFLIRLEPFTGQYLKLQVTF